MNYSGLLTEPAEGLKALALGGTAIWPASSAVVITASQHSIHVRPASEIGHHSGDCGGVIGSQKDCQIGDVLHLQVFDS